LPALKGTQKPTRLMTWLMKKWTGLGRKRFFIELLRLADLLLND
jgi:hypothetical protein